MKTNTTKNERTEKMENNITSVERVQRFTERVSRAKNIHIERADETQFLVASAADPDKFHEVTLDVDGDNMKCTCPDFIFRARKLGIPCKHIIAALDSI